MTSADLSLAGAVCGLGTSQPTACGGVPAEVVRRLRVPRYRSRSHSPALAPAAGS